MDGAVVTGTVVGVGVILTRTAVADVFGVIVMVAAIVRAINTMNAAIVMAATAAIVMTVAVVLVMVMGAVAAVGAVGVIEGDVDSISSPEVMMKGDVSPVHSTETSSAHSAPMLYAWPSGFCQFDMAMASRDCSC